MKFFSTFTGVGGLDMGIDGECIGMSEIDKYASMVLRYKFPNIRNYGDIKKIKWEEIPDFDLLTGGSPCQDFSIAGKRRGLAGTKSSLAWEFIRGLRSKQPRYFIWENVTGVMSSRGGWDIANLITAFSESGYSLWWQVLNAEDFNVPQNRKRIYVIGTRGESTKEILFKISPNQETWGDNELNQGQTIYFDDSVPTSKTRRGRVKRTAGTITTRPTGGIIQLNNPAHSNDRVYDENGISPTLNTMQGGMRQPFIAKTIRVGGGKSPHGSKQNWDSYEIDGKIRRITPLEAERLMSWPDYHTQYGIDSKGNKVEISDSQRYKMCGNGVITAVVRKIVKHLL